VSKVLLRCVSGGGERRAVAEMDCRKCLRSQNAGLSSSLAAHPAAPHSPSDDL